MNNHWKELLPIDVYQVKAEAILHDYYRKTLTSLYQPLIGAVAYSLYMTLWSQIESEQEWSMPMSHRNLMNVVQLELDQILQARKKLEAIGLLKSFVHEGDERRTFFYLLEAPLSPHRFFDDGALNVYLYNRLGHHHFQRVKGQFTAAQLEVKQGYREVTAAFDEVYESVHASELAVERSSEMHQALKPGEHERYVSESSGTSITLSEAFDVEWLQQSLSEFIVPQVALTPDIIATIKKLAYIYKIEPLQMKHIVESTYVKHDGLTTEGLRKATQEWYAFYHHNELPHLSIRVQPVTHRTLQTETPQTEEEKAIALFETISPYEQLQKMAGGAKPASSDIKLVESLMFDQQLLPGVVNVLIEYVMRTNDMKLTRPYVEKIAAHWARKKIQTVKEAMALAKAEHKKYATWSTKSSGRKRTAAKRNPRKDTLPKWIEEEIDRPQQENDELKKKQLEDLLDKYK